MSKIFSKFHNVFGSKNPVVKLPKRDEIRPRKEWEWMLISFTIITLAFSVFAVYFYIKVDSGSFFSIKDSNKLNETRVNQDLFKKTLDEIKAREDSYVDLNLKETPKDPLLNQ